MEEFGKCIKSMDESVKCIIERSQIHCEKCQGCKLKLAFRIFSGFGQISS